LFCDGTAVSRTQYSDLFAVIGTTFGVGDGSTTFNLPDTRGIFLRGAGTNPSNGSNTTTIGTRQLDDFKGHTHTPNGGGEFIMTGGIGTLQNWVGGGGSFNRFGATGSTGGTETRPANIGVNYIIRFAKRIIATVAANTETVALKRFSTSPAQINSAVTTYVDFPTADIDTHNGWVSASGAYNPATGTWSTQNPVYRVPVSGVYLMTATVGFQTAAFASSYNCITLFKNASGFADGSNAGSATSTQYQTTASGIVRCNAGDLLGVFVFQDTGGTRNLQNFGLPRTQISIMRIGN
jgi:hypothetical protein